MSYILTGSGSLLAPCLGHLIGKEMARLAPCFCVTCSRMISSTFPDRAKFLPFPVRKFDSSITNRYSLPQVSRTGATDTGPSPETFSYYRERYPNPNFREKYYTNFASSLPNLGQPSPLNINLCVSVGPEPNTGLSYRFLHTSPVVEDKGSSSKVEETVIRLKERAEQELDEQSRVEDLEKKINSVMEQADLAVKVSVEKKKASAVKRSVWEKVVAEAKHYYSGFKLLFLDVKISSKIIYKTLYGKTLSRRENRQLVRTVSDLFRLVPFSVFILVPFMELLLPVALKLFPGMLPSTFTSADENEKKMRRTLQAKLEYARFLQKTLDDMSPTDTSSHHSQSASDFVKFYEAIKVGGAESVTNKDILKFSKLFEDSITLDNMTRGQLVAICRLLELTPIGTNAFLRFQIEMQLRKLKADDVIIAKEGVEQMTVGELQVACKERGMRAVGITQEKLVRQLKQWIELSTNEKVPPSLLLLSRTLYLPDTLAPAKAIEASIGALPEAVATGAKAKIGEKEGKIDNVTRLEIIQQEQAKIDEEAKELEKIREEKERKAVEEKQKAERLAQDALEKAIDEQSSSRAVPPAPPTTDSIVREATSILRRATVNLEGDVAGLVEASQGSTIDDIHVGRAEVLQESAPIKPTVKPIEEELSVEDLAALRSAIETLSSEKGNKYIGEHDVLHELRQELVDYAEDVGEMDEVAKNSGRKGLKQSKGAVRLFKKVNNMLVKANTVVAKLKSREQKLTENIDILQDAGEKTEACEGHLVTVQDLLGAVRGLQEIPDSSRLERISEVVASMDDDSDGIVKVEHVNKVIEILGRDNVQLSTKQVKQIIDLIGKEEMLEVEGKIEKILGKIPNIEVIKTEKAVKENLNEVKTEKDLTEDVGDNLLEDKAVELNNQEMEKHMEELFSRPVEVKREESSQSLPKKNEAAGQIISRKSLDNSVKDITHSIKKEEEKEEPEKIPQSNGSSKH